MPWPGDLMASTWLLVMPRGVGGCGRWRCRLARVSGLLPVAVLAEGLSGRQSASQLP
jgi:hypothetical protein